MANFGLGRLRLVKPRDGWPNVQAQRSASGADRILEGVALFDTVRRGSPILHGQNICMAKPMPLPTV